MDDQVDYLRLALDWIAFVAVLNGFWKALVIKGALQDDEDSYNYNGITDPLAKPADRARLFVGRNPCGRIQM